MDAQKIASAAHELSKNQAALEWLKQYGEHLYSGPKVNVEVYVRLQIAEGCKGAGDAQAALNAAARLYVKDIVEHAIRNAENTIEILRSNIEQEVTART